MNSDVGDDNIFATQISVAGLEDYVTANMLLDYFEDKIGMVWRCRLKTSSTPVEGYPNYDIDVANTERMNNRLKTEPHAYVHFAIPHSAQLALDEAGRGELSLGRKQLKVSLGPQNSRRLNERRRAVPPHKLPDVVIETGVIRNQDEFIVGWKIPQNREHSGVDFLVDPFSGTCKIQFVKDVAFSIHGEDGVVVMKCDFKVEFSPREINEIKRYRHLSYLIIVLQLASSPLVYYRTAADDIVDTVPFDMMDDYDPWIRTTDFTPSGAIGRCNTYRILIKPRYGPTLLKALEYLRRRRVKIHDECRGEQFRILDEPGFGVIMLEPFFCIQYIEGISFRIMFLLNAILHKDIINQHQLSEAFYDLLRTQPEELVVAGLKQWSSYKRPSCDALKTLKSVLKWLLRNPKLLDRSEERKDYVEVRRLVITPTKAYCLPEEVELSNRVLRNYRDKADRFLRVTFMDEAMQMLTKNALVFYGDPILRERNSVPIAQRTAIHKRVRDIIRRGFHLCGRKYSFLAFSANQLRDRSAWFFAEDGHTTVDNITSWMGKFKDRNVARYAARMGQCFSSTYATVQVPLNRVEPNLPDIERNGYVFSDGIGMISPDLAQEVAEKLQLSENPPSAYQIRYAGFKGVVACWPAKINGKDLYLRESMSKFTSRHTMLEICSWTRFQPGFLNRQNITLLTALGVPDDIFWRMQETMISRLNQMFEDADVAFDVLTASCSDLVNTAAIMLSAGFRPQTEPHLGGMLASIRAGQLGDLREKARIFVPSGRWLMGCLDELDVLEQGQCFIQVSNSCLENCFVKHGSTFTGTNKKLQVIKGLVAIAKNPCLHPGDVRILEAVDVPELHHLYDCLVFPQRGDRPHANEASGSDLDGDLYFVTWDENLISPSKRSWPPMAYVPAKTKEHPREIKHSDIMEFFSRSMVNENLGTICNAHVVHADLSEYGALDEKCVKLAELAAIAVDFPKTGEVAKMPPEMRPKMYPDFMGKEEFQTYKSKKILGRLYRRIKDAYDNDYEASSQIQIDSGNIIWDPDLEVAGSASFLDDAWSYKCSYDGQLLGLLGQYRVDREEELVTGHVWSMPRYSSNKQGELKERLKHAYSALRKEFRQVFEKMVPGFEQLSNDDKNIMYERKASAWYQVTYRESWMKKSKESLKLEDTGSSLMLSFAWIAADYLARIKVRRRREENAISAEPIDSLARYLADKI